MDTYGAIKTDQYGIEPAKMIRTICNLQYGEKQDVMAAVETNKKVYLFYQAPSQTNEDYMEAFKKHIKVSISYNGAGGYHPGLAEIFTTRRKQNHQ